MAVHEIIIKRDPSTSGTEGTSPPPSRGIATQKGGSAVPQSNIAGAVQAGAAKVATQAVQSIAQTYMANRTNEINVLTGSAQYAQRQAAIQSVASAGINLATGAISGSAMASIMGLAAGPAAWIGLAVSAATTAISAITDYKQAKDQIETNYKAEEQQLDYMRSRAGPWYNGSR